MKLNMETFFRRWFHGLENCFVELTFIAPPDSGIYPKTSVSWASLPYAKAKPRMVEHIHKMNAKGYGCYFGVTPSEFNHQPVKKHGQYGDYVVFPRRKEADVPAIPGVWLDLDTDKLNIDYMDAALALRECEIKPSITIYTGGGIHAYYKFTRPLLVWHDDKAKERVKNTIKGMVKHFEALGADSQSVDMARVFRIPDTVNTKPGRGQTTRIIDWTIHTTSIDELNVVFYQTIPRPQPRVTRSVPVTDRDLDDLPNYVRDYIAHGATQGGRNHALYVCARFFNDAGKSQSEAEQVLGQRAGMDGLDGDEINTTIASAYRASRSAIMPPTYQTRLAVRDSVLGGKKS
jgi:hypothetical protein